MNHRHPETGYHYVHILARVPTFSEIWRSYEAFSARCPWMSVLDARDFDSLRNSEAYQDPGLFIVTWVHSYAGPREHRKAKVASVYAEAVGPRETMLGPHKERWDEWAARIKDYDLLLGHTPFMAEEIGKLGVPSAIYPVGWDPEVVGGPDFSKERENAFVFYGSMAGVREWAIPALKARLGGLLQDKTGTFGVNLSYALRNAVGNLYIPHSYVQSFSTWRTWQSLPAGSAMVGENSDIWPLVPDVHYLTIPRITTENVDTVAGRLRSILENPSELQGIARRAWDEVACGYTVEKVVRNFLVPASVKLK